MVVDSVNHFVPRFQLIKCKTRISAEGNLNEVFVQESDLVLVEVKGDSNLTRSRAFALVEGVSRERGRWQPGDEGEGSRKAGRLFMIGKFCL